tara:strand:+ start:121 stop:963 length:843 start_codon:yes stop_codon:yes gene_type:complete
MKHFLKWAGGKTQIMEHITKNIPNTINNYHEPFVGGGSVLFKILELKTQNKIKIQNVFAYDVNEHLINLYNHIKFSYEIFSQLYNYFVSEYHNSTNKSSCYYKNRELFNNSETNSIQKSVLFLFLNKTCFRGLYREGPHGFNVPYEHNKTMVVIEMTKHELESISQTIQDVTFIHCDFSKVFPCLKQNDFVYLDPPYAPESNKSFVNYTKNGFSYERHKELFELIIYAHGKGVNFLLSNAKVNLVTDTFKDYNIQEIVARRSIHSKNPDSTTMEVLIGNI